MMANPFAKRCHLKRPHRRVTLINYGRSARWLVVGLLVGSLMLMPVQFYVRPVVRCAHNNSFLMSVSVNQKSVCVRCSRLLAVLTPIYVSISRFTGAHGVLAPLWRCVCAVRV